MANLNQWQKITRVLPGKPFGNGADGTYTSTTIPTITYKSCSGTADSTTLTASTSSPFTVGDVVLIHQSRGTDAGQWEINRISAVGSGQYTMQIALKYTYTDSGASQAQVVKIPMYSSITVTSGTWTATAWGGDTGGIFPIACSGTATLSNAITCVGKGFRQPTGHDRYSGEGTGGEATEMQQQNGNGGGAGWPFGGSQHKHGGAGGGNGTAGENGHYSDGASSSGSGGTTSGTADLTNCTFGGAGGSGISNHNGAGSGGGCMFVFAKNVSGSATVSIDASSAVNGDVNGGNGGGAGGSLLIVAQTVNLSSMTVTALGTAGSGSEGTGSDGGDGGEGRVAVHYSASCTGSTNPSATTVQDNTLIENIGGYMM
jgi:hypothetical protein